MNNHDRRDNSELVDALKDAMHETQELHAEDIKRAIKEHQNSDHHKWIDSQIEKEKRKQELWMHAKKAAVGVGAGAAVIFFFTEGWELLKEKLK